MLLLVLLLAAIESATPSGEVVPEVTPSCGCTISAERGPCGPERETCRCQDGHAWTTIRLYDRGSRLCEEYLLPDADRQLH